MSTNINRILYLSVLKEDEKLVAFLLKHGADPNARIDTTRDLLDGKLDHNLDQDIRKILRSFPRSEAINNPQLQNDPEEEEEDEENEDLELSTRSELQLVHNLIYKDAEVKSSQPTEKQRSQAKSKVSKDCSMTSQPSETKRGRSFSFSFANPFKRNPHNRLGAAGSSWDVRQLRELAEQRQQQQLKDQQLPEAEPVRTRSFGLGFIGRSLSRGLFFTRKSNKPSSGDKVAKRRTPDWRNMPTALHQAAARGHLGIIRELVRNGADPNIPLMGEFGPLDVAILYRRYETVQLLLDLGADVEGAGRATGKTALHYALKSRQLDVVRLLLERGARADVRTAEGNTPLHLALEWRSPQALGLLLERKGEIRKDNGGAGRVKDVEGMKSFAKDEAEKLAGILDKCADGGGEAYGKLARKLCELVAGRNSERGDFAREA